MSQHFLQSLYKDNVAYLWISLLLQMTQSDNHRSFSSGPRLYSCWNTSANIQIRVTADNGSAWSETTAGRCYCETDSESLACMNIPTHGWLSWKQYPAQKHNKMVPIVREHMLYINRTVTLNVSCQRSLFISIHYLYNAMFLHETNNECISNTTWRKQF